MKLISFDNVEELDSERFLAYVLDDPVDLKMAEYNVIRNQGYGWAIQMFRCLINGKTELFYLTDKFSKVIEVASHLKREQVIEAVKQICVNVREIRSNSFLSLDSLILDDENLFYDTQEQKVKMIYFPVQYKGTENKQAFYAELFALSVWILKAGNCADVAKEMEVCRNSKGYFPEENQIVEIIENARNGFFRTEEKTMKAVPEMKSALVLEPAQGTDKRIRVDKDKYYIGRKDGAVDGIIQNNRLVGRVHCMVEYEKDNYYIRDLKSLNGTFVNGEQLEWMQPHILHDGDEIIIANMTYRVRIERTFKDTISKNFYAPKSL